MFDFDESVYKYYLDDKDLKEIQLVLPDGEPFVLGESDFGVVERKRNNKVKEKEEQK